MEGATLIKQEEKKLGFLSPRVTEEELEEGKDLFEGVDSPAVRLGKQLKGESVMFQNDKMDSKIQKTPSTFA